jgi:chemotaxis protein CheC
MNPTSCQIDALKELINIGVGHGASMLNSMLRSHILLQVPFIKIISLEELRKEMETLGGDQLAIVRLKFKGSFSGTAELVFPSTSASNLITVLTDEDPGTIDLDSVRAGTLCEVGNIVLNGVMGSISNILQLQLSYTVPNYMEQGMESLSALADTGDNRAILLARARFAAEKLEIEGDIVLLFEVGGFGAFLDAIDTFIVNNKHEP